MHDPEGSHRTVSRHQTGQSAKLHGLQYWTVAKFGSGRYVKKFIFQVAFQYFQRFSIDFEMSNCHSPNKSEIFAFFVGPGQD